jgi:hypothetical protein
MINIYQHPSIFSSGPTIIPTVFIQPLILIDSLSLFFLLGTNHGKKKIDTVDIAPRAFAWPVWQSHQWKRSVTRFEKKTREIAR